ncbi:hypothetical protein MUU75_08165 [Pseudoxanthomonas mexicana]|uniref:hypothetical protein n=1 Tax=Pseudoxanthomonas mexicana TaxID=128785 RepID=UPI001FD71A95|nr:hypothetical protein [Pseudoxanthomonas mexicana]UOV06582.1 hypothetical protein MUU75_08165 [Pseudoxanthomonas mexicana]
MTQSGRIPELGVFAGILLLTAIVFYAATAWVAGPAYLADEIGYLTNGAFIAGHFVSSASSYHAGYSFLLAPLFYFLDDPRVVWRGVLIINAVMWGVSWASCMMLPGDYSRPRHDCSCFWPPRWSLLIQPTLR